MSSLAMYIIIKPKPLRCTGFVLVIIETTIAMQWYIHRSNSLIKLQLIAQLEYTAKFRATSKYSDVV